jgi:hypothetical protein
VADILYVIDGYVDPGYVVAARDASATFISNSTGQWQDMGTWQEPGQEVWQPFIATAITQQGFASTTLSATSTLTSAAIVTIAKTLSVSSSMTATANLLGDGATIKVSSGTLTVDAKLQGIGVSTIASVTQMQTAENHIERTSSIIQGTTTHTVTATLNAAGQSSMVSTAQVSSAIRVGTQLEFQSQVTLDVVAGVTASAQLNSISTITAAAARIRNAQTEFTVISTVSSTGGTQQRVTVTLPAVTSSLATLIAYSVDPERILTILSEIRSLQITQETRLFNLNTETRINIIAQETRSKQILNETRNLVVQHNLLIDVAGTPRDRREG